MLALVETPAGYALFQVNNPKVLKDIEGIPSHFASVDKAKKLIELKQFCKFADNEAAVKAAVCIKEDTLDDNLASFLKKAMADSNDELAVTDKRMGGLLKEKLGLNIKYDDSVFELMRGIREHLTNLVSGLTEQTASAMKLGLSHGLARFTLAFSPEKIDTMIIHSISLLDELDKELNIYAMRAREWYGVHFPELSKITTDNIQFAKTIRLMGLRTNASKTDLSNILDEDTEHRLKEAAEVSMGTEIAEEDIVNIQLLCDQVVSLGEYRVELYQYLQNRMNAIAPNLTALVGELVGARLIAHSGSLINLAKAPASTVQILGAEKALFRAIKTKHDTPKYGLIFHASLVGQAQPKAKGKIARMLAAKTSLSVREDALGETDGVTIGYEHRLKVEARLRQIESSKMMQSSGTGKAKPGFQKFDQKKSVSTYNESADMSLKSVKRKRDDDDDEDKQVEVKKEKKEKKDKEEKKDKKDKKEKKEKKEKKMHDDSE